MLAKGLSFPDGANPLLDDLMVRSLLNTLSHCCSSSGVSLPSPFLSNRVNVSGSFGAASALPIGKLKRDLKPAGVRRANLSLRASPTPEVLAAAAGATDVSFDANPPAAVSLAAGVTMS